MLMLVTSTFISMCLFSYKSVKSSLDIPSVIQVQLLGYPTNENGETYGPSVKNYSVSPDLVLVCNNEGEYGYIRNSDFFNYSTTEEALTSNKFNKKMIMYMQDGVTVIGIFELG